MKVLVIPDCHLKPWMFAQANTIMKKGIADKAVCLMDLADDFGVHDDAQYLETYETAIAFAKEHPDTLWCYGNHDLSYIWGKPETGYHPEKRGLVCQEIKKLTNTLPKKSQLAYIHKIDKTLFMHGGLANLFVQLRVAPQNRKNVLAAVKAINQMSCETMWATDSPIWYPPRKAPATLQRVLQVVLPMADEIPHANRIRHQVHQEGYAAGAQFRRHDSGHHCGCHERCSRYLYREVHGRVLFGVHQQ